jgi:hypothetical protein
VIRHNIGHSNALCTSQVQELCLPLLKEQRAKRQIQTLKSHLPLSAAKSFFAADSHFAQVDELVGVVGFETVVDAGPHQPVAVVVPVAVAAVVVVAVAVVGGTAVASVVAVQCPFK